MDTSATRRSADPERRWSVTGQVLALVELGPVTLEALPDGVCDEPAKAAGASLQLSTR